MGVAYHFFKDLDTTASINDRIRTTYDGPRGRAVTTAYLQLWRICSLTSAQHVFGPK